MRDANPQAIYLKDYKAPSHKINSLDLDFTLKPSATRVKAKLEISRQDDTATSLRLHGEQMKLITVAINGQPLTPAQYAVDDESLTLIAPPAEFTLETEVEIDPSANTALEGLYMSAGRFCTQCEAEGFRRITYMLDRPDVLTTYRVRMAADKAQFPRLLSNGNLVDSGEQDNGWHYAIWEDPFPKPSYLFALVAGSYDVFEDTFTTCTGRTIDLKIYTDVGESHKAAYAMDALKRSMRWDEEAFGREYDLDLFMIVAVRDFNFGAMENKGLNIFNSAYLLADPKLATDADYEAIEGIVAHEYFHNWTGNRITCRDWFQLCLKEGLTVYRDQEFSASQRGAAITRIKDVKALRSRQFTEDDGPLAHPVRPDHFVEINNFYTATVYEKGAELIRMLSLMLGAETFRKGMDLYFNRHDGEATTIEAFLACFAEASNRDLGAFQHWYHQAGRPRVSLQSHWDDSAKRLTLSARQSTPATPGQPDKRPMVIPIRTGLVNGNGDTVREEVLVLDQTEKTWTFDDLAEEPAVSALRGFSAPITLDFQQDQGLSDRLMAHDADWFNRWELQQETLKDLALANGALKALDDTAGRFNAITQALRTTLENPDVDTAFKALCLSLPSEREISQSLDVINPDAVHEGHETLRYDLATTLSDLLGPLAKAPSPSPFAPDAASAGQRALRNAALGLLAALKDDEARALAQTAFDSADNMTDELAALSVLMGLGGETYVTARERFYETYKAEPLVVDKWFSLQARDPHNSAQDMRRLMDHPAFDGSNPNRLRAVVQVFALMNPTQFHDLDGTGYEFLADQILAVDGKNASLAARLTGAFESWRRYSAPRQEAMKRQLQRILAHENLSKNNREQASKILGTT